MMRSFLKISIIFLFSISFLLNAQEITVIGKVHLFNDMTIVECSCYYPELDTVMNGQYPDYAELGLGIDVIDIVNAIMFLNKYVEVTGAEAVGHCFDSINMWNCHAYDALTQMTFTTLMNTPEITIVQEIPTDCESVLVTVLVDIGQEIVSATLLPTIDGHAIYLDLTISTYEGPAVIQSISLDADLGIFNAGNYSIILNMHYVRDDILLFEDMSYAEFNVYSNTLGDLNHDQIIDVLDLVTAVDCILHSNGDCTCADMNADNTVDILDVVLMVEIILDE
ncbi:MAG: hypothetical protein HQ510_01340 [Candidatus Marinimicrobia bacterium]|nr:hypothetical protein [Candidatus Neomarinimicrobiota bacterium]